MFEAVQGLINNINLIIFSNLITHLNIINNVVVTYKNIVKSTLNDTLHPRILLRRRNHPSQINILLLQVFLLNKYPLYLGTTR